MKRFLSFALVPLLFCMTDTVDAEELRLYRYTNNDGNVVIRPSIPPEYVAGGYQVINSKGRVLQTVAPALTPAEVIEERETQLRALAEEQAQRRRQEDDAALLSAYSQPEDVMQALQRALDEIDERQKVEQGNLQSMQKQKEAQQAEAARLERSGRAVPDRLVRDIADYDQQIARLQGRIEELQNSKRETRLRYIADQRRLEELLAADPLLSGNWPEALEVEQADLAGLWRLRLDDGSEQEWVLNPSGTFTSLREKRNGERLLILGTWELVERTLHVAVVAQHRTNSEGRTEILSNPPAREYPLLDFKPKELVLQVERDVIRLQR